MQKQTEFYRYQVYFTPLLNSSDEYGEEIDVTDYVLMSGIPKVRRSIDASDYQVGVYTYDDINLKVQNVDGKFNTEQDNRSIFVHTRDRCKVRVVFTPIDTDGEDTENITFRGLINEEATRMDPISELMTFKVLSRDSVMRNTKVAAGLISNGTDSSTAILNILSQSRITSVLNVSAGNINPDLEVTLDVGSAYDNRPTKDAMDELLLITNSVMVIDSSDNVIVKSRDEDEVKAPLMLYGPFDEHGRENVIDMTSYNTGYHRVFTSVKVNNSERSNSSLQSLLGVRQKQFSLDAITNTTTEEAIAQRLLDEFKAPKIELNISGPTFIAKDYDLLDRASLNWPLRVKPVDGTFLPVIGFTKIGDTSEPLPNTFGSLSVDPRIVFKIIRIDENPETFETVFKLRQAGTEINDGYYDEPGSSIIGYAVIGEAVIGEGDIGNEQWNPSVIGAALIGQTEVV